MQNGTLATVPDGSAGIGCEFHLSMCEAYYVDDVELLQIEERIGYLPEHVIFVTAGCRTALDARLLVEIASLICEAVDGWIAFDFLLHPASTLPTERLWDRRLVSGWSLDQIRKFIDSFPGTVYEIERDRSRDEVDERDVIKAYHLVDPTYLRAWLQYPGFYIP